MTIEVTVSSINYNKTFESLMPVFLHHIEHSGKNGFAEKLILKLGKDTAGKALENIAGYLSENDRNEVLCGALNSFSDDVNGRIADELSRKLPSVKLESVSAYNTGNGLKVYLNNVEADIAELINDPAVSELFERKAREAVTEKLGPFAGTFIGKGTAGLVKGLVSMNPEAAEDIIIQVLNSGKYSRRICEAIEKAVSEWADVRIDEINIIRSTAEHPALVTHLPALLSDEWEDKLINAVVSYIKELTAAKQ